MASAASTGKEILVVDDNEIARAMVSTILQGAGFTAIPCDNGRKALDYLRASHRPNLILLDMLMPVMDGWKFLQELRHWSKPLEVPIIVTTGTILTHEWAIQNGLAGFIRKPIDPDTLLAEIRRCLPSS